MFPFYLTRGASFDRKIKRVCARTLEWDKKRVGVDWKAFNAFSPFSIPPPKEKRRRRANNDSNFTPEGFDCVQRARIDSKGSFKTRDQQFHYDREKLSYSGKSVNFHGRKEKSTWSTSRYSLWMAQGIEVLFVARIYLIGFLDTFSLTLIFTFTMKRTCDVYTRVKAKLFRVASGTLLWFCHGVEWENSIGHPSFHPRPGSFEIRDENEWEG